MNDGPNEWHKTQTSSRLVLTTAAASLGFVVIQLDVTIVNVALVQIADALRADVSSLQWVVDGYAVVFAAFLLTAGGLGDRFGARRIFVAGFGIFTLASLACGLAPSAEFLIAARALQGIGAAAILPCSLAVLSHAARGDHAARSRAIGWWTAAGGAAIAAGPVIGGLLIDWVGWRAVFLVNIPIGLVGIWLALRAIAETPAHNEKRFDIAGQVFAVAGLILLIAAIIETGRRGVGDPVVIGGFVLGVLAAVAFVAAEARTEAPLMPLKFFREATFSTALAVGLLINLSFYGLVFVLSLYFQRMLGYGPVATGLAFVPMTAIVMASNVAGGALAGQYGSRWPMAAGAATGALGYALIGLTIGPQTPYVWLLPGMLLIPIGIGLAVPAMTAATLSIVAPTQAGIASGMLNTVRQAGGAAGVAIFGALLHGQGDQMTAAMRAVLAISTAMLLAAAVLSVLGVRARQKGN